MLFALFFAFWRFLQIVTLLPAMGIMAWYVHVFVSANMLTPNYILILFIASVLGIAWCIFTLFSYHRSSTNAMFVAIIDLGFVGTFIAAVYSLRFIAGANCVNVNTSASWVTSAGSLSSLGAFGVDISVSKPCATLKTAFAIGIMNCIFFFFTAIFAMMHGNHLGKDEREKRYVVRETTRVHRHRSGSRSGGSRSEHRTRSGSHQSQRSTHSHQRVYV